MADRDLATEITHLRESLASARPSPFPLRASALIAAAALAGYGAALARFDPGRDESWMPSSPAASPKLFNCKPSSTPCSAPA